jgi:NADH-quinone oxidoreductase subunit E
MHIQPDAVMPIIEKYKTHRGGRIAIPEEIQTRYGCLHEGEFRVVADQTDHALVDIYGAATFYKASRLAPRGKHLTSVCLGTACHVWGGPAGGGLHS